MKLKIVGFCFAQLIIIAFASHEQWMFAKNSLALYFAFACLVDYFEQRSKPKGRMSK